MLCRVLDKNHLPTDSTLSDYAINYYQKTLLPHPNKLAEAYFYKGKGYITHKQENNAMNCFLLAEQLFNANTSYELQGRTYSNIAYIHTSREQYDIAQNTYQKALKTFQKQGNTKHYAYTLLDIGNLYT